MFRPFEIRLCLVASVLGLLFAGSHPAFAQEADVAEASNVETDAKGQEDLDAATALKLGASSMADLEKVIDLCESAIEKGLETESEQLAKSLVTATLFQHGSRFAQALFDPREQSQRPQMLKKFALTDLYKILEYDDSLPQVHMMIARLEAVSAGTRINEATFKKGVKSADRAIALLEDDAEMRSKAIVLRAGYARTNKERMSYLDKAIEADAKNTDAWRLRGKNRLVEGELLAAAGQLDKAKEVRQKAVDDFSKLLEANPDDPDALQAVAELLSRLGNNEEALTKANAAIEKNPRAPSLYILRGRIHHEQKNYEDAIKDLNRAVDLQPDSYIAVLDRLESHFDSGDKEAAAKDFRRAREIQGQQGIARAVMQRVTVRAQGKYENAIRELKRFVEVDELDAKESDRKPDYNLRLQLSETYSFNKQPLESIDSYSVVLDEIGNSATGNLRKVRMDALEGRANAYLGIGKHAESITDYEAALKLNSKSDGILNNLAWVLATSPQDDIRDGKKAIKLATDACKVTQYNAPHILSTLAASYAEDGNFEDAVKWSTEAVEKLETQLADQLEKQKLQATPLQLETQKQLKNELASYEEKKPWRETQDVTEEKESPAESNDDGEAEDDVEEVKEESPEVVEEEAVPANASGDE